MAKEKICNCGLKESVHNARHPFVESKEKEEYIWWNSLNEHQQQSIKKEYHLYFQFALIKDLSESDIRIAFVLVSKGELNYY